MSWDDLRYVLALSRARTLSGAATALAVTHTTVGRRLDEIEREMGLRVFDRTPDGYVPTAAGQELVLAAERVEAEVLAAEGRVLGRDRSLGGALRVSTMDLFFRAHNHVFATFVERYPSVDLTVTTTDDEVSLPRRQADVVLRMSNAPPKYLVGRKARREAEGEDDHETLMCSPRRGPALGFDIPGPGSHASHVEPERPQLSADERAWLEHDDALRARARAIAARSCRDPEDIYKALRQLERSATARLALGLRHGRLRGTVRA